MTIFTSRFDNKTDKGFGYSNWNGFVDGLKELSEIPREKKEDAALMSMAVFKKDTTRANKNVDYWSKWVAVDVDDYEGKMEDIDVLHHNLDMVVYSTASSTKEKPKFRIIFRLNRQVEPDEIRHFWYALNKELGDIGDPQTKDMARMFYIPAQYKDAHNFFIVNKGACIDVDELKSLHEYKEKHGNSFLDRLPEEMQKAVIQHRKDSMQNTSIRWNSYRDCPFFPKKLSMEYVHIRESGWYHKMYQIMVATACNALKREYPITATQIAQLCSEFDRDNGNWYENRPLQVEADRAVEYAYRNN